MNTAAERLRVRIFNEFNATDVLLLDQALADERRATVERIRADIAKDARILIRAVEWVNRVDLNTILDAEADRE
jgi:hypothetical protein